MKQKVGSLKISKIDTLLTKLIKIKKKKTQINKFRSEKGCIITNINEIQKIIRGML
jgi:hypothetical protein